MGAKFEVDDVFSIKGRGYIIAGWIRDGVVKTGMQASLPALSQRITIVGIERFSTAERPQELRGMVGLLLSLGDEEAVSVWKGLDLKGQILEIEE